uniref:F-box domain-containing protein n=1 Tax=Caenorhabditis tropicalis TaxID=1561998 RepID=A0A1I7UHZ3_9PELO
MFQSNDMSLIIDAKEVDNECFVQVFHRLDKKSLLNCTLACHRFHELISNDAFWVEHARIQNISNVLPSLPWRRAAIQKNFKTNQNEEIETSNFNFNLKRMVLSRRGYSTIFPCLTTHFENTGSDIFRGVVRTDDFSIRASADGIQMERNGGVGCQPHPAVSKCFAYSFSASAMTVFIDLVNSGIDEWVLDYVRPKIRVSQKVNHRHDCSATLTFGAQLNYHETQWIREFGLRQIAENTDNKRYKSINKEWDQWTEDQWEDEVIEFDDYPSGMRHLTIMNEGKDGLFWKGFYGPKIANIQVQVILPEVPTIKSAVTDTERCNEDNVPEDENEPIRVYRLPIRRRRHMWAVPPAVAREEDDQE